MHKLGSKRNEDALTWRKVGVNFKQSRDIHEDRSTLQTRHVGRKNSK